MSVETLNDIAEEMADLADIYGGCLCASEVESDRPLRGRYCCRGAFVLTLTERMRAAALVERKLAAPEATP